MRLNKMFLVLGKKGSGKTYYTIHTLIEQYHTAHPKKKILVYNTDDHPDYRYIPRINPGDLSRWTGAGIYRIVDSDATGVISLINEYVYNGLVIFEDASKYINKRLQKSAWDAILNSKQHNLDILFQFHGFAACPPEILRQCDVITMFRCDSPAYRRDELVEYEAVQAAYNKVMASKEDYPHKTVIVA